MSVSCLILADAPAPEALALDDSRPGVQTSRVQIAKTGSFKDPRYGAFKITRLDFKTWETNFLTLHRSGGRLGLPVDVDHSPEKQGKTEAAGWVVKLDTLGEDGKTPTPDELWATTEWNTLGVELIQGRRYAYLSPSYQHNFTDEQGKQHGTALVGVGLTNRPFLTMATVTLSAALDAVAASAVEVPDSPGHMTDLLADIRKALSLGSTDDDATVLAKVQELATAKPAKPEPTTDKTLAELASAQGAVLLNAADFASLQTSATAGAAAAKELAEAKFESAFGKALSEGRATPAIKENFVSLYAANPDLTLKTLEGLPVMVNTTPGGHTGTAPANDPSLSRDADGFEVDPERVELHNRTLAIASEKNIDYGAALQLAATEMGVR